MADGNDYILKVSNLRVKLQNQTIPDNVSFKLMKGTTLAAARNISSDLLKYSTLSAIFDAISSISGALLTAYLVLPPRPLVVFLGIAVFLATVLIKWKMR